MHAPAMTIARMAIVAGISPDALREANRPDAAEFVEKLAKKLAESNPGDSITFADGHSDRGFDLTFFNQGETHAVIEAKTPHRPVAEPDEIDLIYASATMSAREKLLRIRQVLELRAQAEAEEARQREAAPAPEAETAANGEPENQPS